MNNGIVLTSKIKIARNVSDYKFVSKFSQADADKIINIIRPILITVGVKTNKLSELDDLTQDSLIAKGIMTETLKDNAEFSAIALSNDDALSVMINEDDHIIIQCVLDDVSLLDAFKKAKIVDEAIANKIKLAYDDEFGYLCACPTNVGTGIRASINLSLPLLVKTNEIQKIINSMSVLGISITNDNSACKYNFLVENSTSLGQTEMDIITKVQSAVMRLIDLENAARRDYFSKHDIELRDACMRAYGIISFCYKISFGDLMENLTLCKIGTSLNILQLDIAKIDNVMNNAPYPIMCYENKKIFDGNEYEIALAKLVKSVRSDNDI